MSDEPITVDQFVECLKLAWHKGNVDTAVMHTSRYSDLINRAGQALAVEVRHSSFIPKDKIFFFDSTQVSTLLRKFPSEQ